MLSLKSSIQLGFLLLLLALFPILFPSPVSADSSFLYSASGQRIAKLSGEGDHTYYLPGMEVTVKPDGSLSSRKYYTFNGALVGIRDKSGISYTHSDQLGSAALTTDANGSLVGSAAYFPYGTTRGLSGTMAGERKYTGQVSDEDMTGLYYYNARYYSPTLGRFTQADTAQSGQNKYAYVSNNPTNTTDPTGNCEDWDYWCQMGENDSVEQGCDPEDFACRHAGDSSFTPSSESSQSVNWDYYTDLSDSLLNPIGLPYINHPLYFDSSYIDNFSYYDLPWWTNIPVINIGIVIGSTTMQHLYGGYSGTVQSNFRNQAEYIDYRNAIFADVDFTAETELEFLQSFAQSVHANTIYDIDVRRVYENAWAEGREPTAKELQSAIPDREGYLITRITTGNGICRHFAAISNLMLGDLGIASEVFDSDNQNHSFLRVYIGAVPYIIDPTLGEAMSQSEYSLKYGVNDYVYIGSYVTPICPSGACHQNP